MTADLFKVGPRGECGTSVPALCLMGQARIISIRHLVRMSIKGELYGMH